MVRFTDRTSNGKSGKNVDSGKLQTDITLTVLVKPATFVKEVDNYLKLFADRLRTTVIVKKSEGAMEVFEWNSRDGGTVHH